MSIPTYGVLKRGGPLFILGIQVAGRYMQQHPTGRDQVQGARERESESLRPRQDCDSRSEKPGDRDRDRDWDKDQDSRRQGSKVQT